MDIEIGDYVRTSKGKIFTYCKGRAYLGRNNEIIKHSKDIIDLVEVGDYVNGNKVIDKYLFGGELPVLETTGDEKNAMCLSEKDIKSVLTREKFEANCYELEE